MSRTNYSPAEPLGVQAITATTAAAGVVIAAASAASATRYVYPDYAIFFSEAASCRWDDNPAGATPTGTIGMPFPFGQYFYYDGRLDRIKFAANTTQSIIVWAALYKAGA